MTDCRSPTYQRHLNICLSVHGAAPGLAISKSTPWLTEMIFCAKKIKKNCEDLRDLCTGTLEIVGIIENEIKAHGEIAAARFIGPIETFISAHTADPKVHQMPPALSG
ncbi:hypothetical protein K438DRAFT_1780267 [Mycena galopus ATCC 62051]|nr:hypothetical protein K438DRAFT_1780267 [Mycena galopus ATCC 62051]